MKYFTLILLIACGPVHGKGQTQNDPNLTPQQQACVKVQECGIIGDTDGWELHDCTSCLNYLTQDFDKDKVDWRSYFHYLNDLKCSEVQELWDYYNEGQCYDSRQNARAHGLKFAD